MCDVVIFDLDDTLIDYSAARGLAQQAIRERLFVECPELQFDAFWSDYRAAESALFRDFAAGVLSRDEYRRLRFANPLARNSKQHSYLAEELNATYMAIGNTSQVAFSGVHSLLHDLRIAKRRIVLLTNGPSDGQRQKLRANGLEHLFDCLFISEETGIAKPDPRAFLQCVQWAHTDVTHVLMVGDSLDDDIRPAIGLGIATVHVGQRIPDDHTGCGTNRVPAWISAIRNMCGVPRAE